MKAPKLNFVLIVLGISLILILIIYNNQNIKNVISKYYFNLANISKESLTESNSKKMRSSSSGARTGNTKSTSAKAINK